MTGTYQVRPQAEYDIYCGEPGCSAVLNVTASTRVQAAEEVSKTGWWMEAFPNSYSALCPIHRGTH